MVSMKSERLSLGSYGFDAPDRSESGLEVGGVP